MTTLTHQPLTWARWYRPLALGLALTWASVWAAGQMRYGWYGPHLGWDFTHYLEGTRLWLATGSPYTPASVAGPYPANSTTMPFLHPPIALPLFAPFLVLPAIVWWAVPIAVLAYALCRWRPAGAWWYAALACIVYPRTIEIALVGNSDMWVSAGVAAGLLIGWPALLVVIKPYALPLALGGMRHRSFWIGAVIVVGVSLLFGSLWLDWIAVVRHTAGSGGYLLHGIPLLLLPVAAWAGRAPS